MTTDYTTSHSYAHFSADRGLFTRRRYIEELPPSAIRDPYGHRPISIDGLVENSRRRSKRSSMRRAIHFVLRSKAEQLRPRPPMTALQSGRPCRECGKPFSAKRDTREFCDASCRRIWNNRRATRGAILFDAVMAWRFQRDAFEAAGGRKLLGQLASAFRAQDERDRGGRRSWDELCKTKQRHPQFFATVVGINIAGVRK